MRKMLVVLFLWITTGLEVTDAAYIIKLKNGNEYLTESYWQKGSQVLFSTYGGIFGVDKTFVAKIEKSLQTDRIASAKDPVGDARTNAEIQNKDSSDPTPGSKPKAEKKRDPNDSVVSEYNRLRDRAKEVNGLLTSEIRELLKEITAFKNKLSRDGKLFIEYGREFNDAHEIGDTVESALRSRIQ